MNIEECILQLKYILATVPLSEEQTKSIEFALIALQKDNSIDRRIEIAKMLANLFSVGIKFFDS